MISSHTSLAWLSAVSLIAAPLAAQTPARTKTASPRPATRSPRPALQASAPLAAPYDSLAFAALRWREIGPFRGGRSVAVAGSASRPM